MAKDFAYKEQDNSQHFEKASSPHAFLLVSAKQMPSHYFNSSTASESRIEGIVGVKQLIAHSFYL